MVVWTIMMIRIVLPGVVVSQSKQRQAGHIAVSRCAESRPKWPCQGKRGTHRWRTLAPHRIEGAVGHHAS